MFSSVAIAQILRGNLRDDIPGVDPAAFNGLIAHRLLSLTYEGLTGVAPDGGIVPALATRWETPDEGRTWRFYLRPGVKFHSGRSLTAADVRSSFEIALTAKRPPVAAQLLENIVGRQDFLDGRSLNLTGVVEDDPLTVTLHFTEPTPLFPYYPIFIFDGGARAAWGANWHAAHSGGTGPFRLAEWRRGREVRLETNKDYWGAVPAAEGVRLLILPSADAALAMFDRGELDFVYLSEPAHRLIAVDERRRGALQAVPRRQARFLAMNPTLYPPFADPKVRRAVSLAIDRDAVIKHLFGGFAATPRGVGALELLGSDEKTDAADQIGAHRYDPSAARRLLADAGYADGVGLPPLDLAVIDASRDEGAYYAQQLSNELGFKIQLRTVERASFIAAANAASMPFFLAGWTADFPDPATYLDALWRSGSRFNQTNWRDPEYDALVVQARRTGDEAARRRLYAAAEKRLVDETAAVAMMPTPDNLLLLAPTAQGLRITPLGHLSFPVVRAPVVGARP